MSYSFGKSVPILFGHPFVRSSTDKTLTDCRPLLSIGKFPKNKTTLSIGPLLTVTEQYKKLALAHKSASAQPPSPGVKVPEMGHKTRRNFYEPSSEEHQGKFMQENWWCQYFVSRRSLRDLRRTTDESTTTGSSIFSCIINQRFAPGGICSCVEVAMAHVLLLEHPEWCGPNKIKLSEYIMRCFKI